VALPALPSAGILKIEVLDHGVPREIYSKCNRISQCVTIGSCAAPACGERTWYSGNSSERTSRKSRYFACDDQVRCLLCQAAQNQFMEKNACVFLISQKISKGYLPAYAQKSAHPYTTSKSCYIDLLQSLRVSDSPLFLKELA
jgi:hypothetical protein